MAKTKALEPVTKQAGIPLHGLAGFILMLASVSVLFADYLVVFGTDDLTTKLLLVPNLLVVTMFFVYKAIK